MNKIELDFHMTVVVDAADMPRDFREELEKDAFEAIYPYEIAEHLKAIYLENPHALIADIRKTTPKEFENVSIHVWERYDNE